MMAGRGRKNADEALVLALAGGQTVQEAARQAKVSERTAHRRLADPGFRLRVIQARAEMMERALGRLAEGMTAAADALRDLLATAPPAVRLGAARALLELGAKLREATELEARVSALEAKEHSLSSLYKEPA